MFQYIDGRAEDRAEPEHDARLAELEQRNLQLESKVQALVGHIEYLHEAMREMQEGFRRHRSEKIAPNQLVMAFGQQADAAVDSDREQAPHTNCEPGSVDETCDELSDELEGEDTAWHPASSSQGPMCLPPPAKKRHRHGRRKIGIVPEVIVMVVPPQVLSEGLEAFEPIGHEDSPVLGYRRGGPLKLVYRRIKYVRRRTSCAQDAAVDDCQPDSGPPAAAAAPEPDTLATDTLATDTLATDTLATDTLATDTLATDTSGRPAARGQSAPISAPMQVASSADDNHSAAEPSIEVFEHDVLVVPKDASFRHNPFVDGAIVRFFPEALGSSEPVLSDDLPPTSPVLVACPAARPIERGLADASLLSHLFVDKLDRHLPYYRQEAELERFGWPIPRGNMARWQHECGQLVRPLVDQMWQQALGRSWFAMDAAGTAIRGSPRYERGHVFVLVAEGQSILFRFSSTYDGATVEQMFGPSTATILADASANHNGLFGPGKATEAGCWSHARRRFVTAFRAGEGQEPARVLQTMQALFQIEREIAPLEPDDRLEVRLQRSAPIVEELLERAAVRRVELDSDSLTRKGFVYLDNQKDALRAFLANGQLPLTNNLSERELRRFVKGRINWLFHNSPDHAQSACALASLIASAELHGLDPELYLQEVLTVLPAYPVRRVLDLSPELWLPTRQRLLADGCLAYIDLARISGSQLRFRSA